MKLMQKTSLIISRTIDIYSVFSVILLVNFYADHWNDTLWFLFYFIVLVLFPIAGDIYLLRQKKISDWDLSVRKERVKYINMDAFLMLFLFLISLIFNAPYSLILLSLILFSIEFIYGLVTLFWKISVHAQLVTLLAIYLSIFFYPIGLLSIFLIPIVFLARLILKMHTPLQLIVGSIISGSIALLIIATFGSY